MVQTGIQTPVTGVANRNATGEPQWHSVIVVCCTYLIQLLTVL